MNKITRLLGISICTLSIQVASAQDFSEQITQRQNAFEQIEQLIGQADDTLDGESTDWHELQTISASLTAQSYALLSLFPEGSQQGSKAKSDVWNKPEKFEQLLTQMDQGFQQLYQASLKGQAPQAESGLEAATRTCKACHRSYRSRW